MLTALRVARAIAWRLRASVDSAQRIDSVRICLSVRGWALAALFGGAVGKDTVSRVWRKVKTDRDA
jgi:hypothetical protein